MDARDAAAYSAACARRVISSGRRMFELTANALDGYVWLIPTLLAVMAASALVLFAAAVVVSTAVRRRPSPATKLAATAVLLLTVFLSVAGIRRTATRIAATLDISVRYVDPGALGYLGFLFFGGFAFLVARRVLGDAWSRPSSLLFYVWLLAFTAVNIVNRCTPGWCETIGFPFTWRSWSDAIGPGEEFRTFTDSLGAILNLLVFAGVAAVLARVRLRCRPHRTTKI